MHSSADHRSVDGQLQRSRKNVLVRGLNRNCNHDIKNLFKGAAAVASSKPGPFHRWDDALFLIDDAARAKIETHRLRRGISVLEGTGGNIAVLTGKDGKLLIDSGFSVSKTRVAEALNNLSMIPFLGMSFALRVLALNFHRSPASEAPELRD